MCPLLPVHALLTGKEGIIAPHLLGRARSCADGGKVGNIVYPLSLIGSFLQHGNIRISARPLSFGAGLPCLFQSAIFRDNYPPFFSPPYLPRV